jgi:hypothetical protein
MVPSVIHLVDWALPSGDRTHFIFDSQNVLKVVSSGREE